MKRKLSLRELRRNLPENVVILPSAAPRRVRQKRNSATRAERAALNDAHPWPGEYLYPGLREAIKQAEIIGSVKPSPALRIVFAILAAMDLEVRKKVVARLVAEAVSDVTEAQQALAIAESTVLTYGDRCRMEAAFRWLAGQDDCASGQLPHG